MDEKAKKKQKISSWKYWLGVVFPRAKNDIWEFAKEQIAMALVILLAAIVASVLSANKILNDAVSKGYISDASSLLRALVAVLVLSLLYLLWSMFYYPTIIHNEGKEIIDGLRDKLRDIENSKPVIYATNPIVKPKGFVNNEMRDAISIDVLNISRGTTAEKVFPTVTWFTMRGKFVTENNGRWWMSTEDAAVTKTADRQVMDLLSNGKAYLFHFSIQSHDPIFFYAWFREANGADKRFPLHEKKYKVKIHFQSNNNVQASFFYVVTNKDGKLFVKEVKGED